MTSVCCAGLILFHTFLLMIMQVIRNCWCQKLASGAESPKALGERKAKVKVLKSIAEKLPAELATV